MYYSIADRKPDPSSMEASLPHKILSRLANSLLPTSHSSPSNALICNFRTSRQGTRLKPLDNFFRSTKMTGDMSLLWMHLMLLVVALPALCCSEMMNPKVLHVGNELKKETLPLNMGSCLYKLQGLQSYKWYEVKISYPASIPSSFSLQLRRGRSDLGLNLGRKLLNTEKLIFKTDNLDLLDDQGGLFVEVNVEPEGVVAIPGVQERKYAIFNIVCDELLLGIPYQAWYVVALVVFCFGVAFFVPSFLPPYLLPKEKTRLGVQQMASKDS